MRIEKHTVLFVHVLTCALVNPHKKKNNVQRIPKALEKEIPEDYS